MTIKGVGRLRGCLVERVGVMTALIVKTSFYALLGTVGPRTSQVLILHNFTLFPKRLLIEKTFKEVDNAREKLLSAKDHTRPFF